MAQHPDDILKRRAKREGMDGHLDIPPTPTELAKGYGRKKRKKPPG